MNDVLQAKFEKRNPFRAKDGSIRLAFCGKMKSGKDTAVNHLKSLHGGTVIHMFASGYRFVEWLMLYPLFGFAIDPDNKTKFERLMLQWIGHWGRVLFGKNIWLNKTLKLIAKTKGNVFVTGVRYPNEVKRLKEIEVQSVWVERPLQARLDAGAFNVSHETEMALDNFKDFDYQIPNDKDLATFLRRVECYTHIGALLDDITDASLERQSRVRAGLGAVPENAAFFDDGVARGWKPEIKDVATNRVEEDRDLLFDARSQWVDNREIANEIERFAGIVRNELKVTNATEAVKSVRQTLHRILDNRPITGEKGEDGADKDTTLLEIRRLAKSIGIETQLVVGEDAAIVRTALALKPTDEGEVLDVSEDLEVEMTSRTYLTDSEVAERNRRAQVERAKRDRYNQARRDRRADARLDKILARNRKRGSKLQATPVKRAAKARK